MTQANTIFPRLKPVTVSPAPDKPDEFIISLDGQPGKVLLGGGAAMVLREFDGRRDCARIAADLRASGVPIPGADFVLALAQAMAQAGLVELDGDAAGELTPPQDLISINPLRHQCIGCGRSCEGHMIGPLDQPFLNRLPDIIQTLGDIYPDIAEAEAFVEPVTFEGKTLHRLVHKPGRGGNACIFLGEDRLCRIHGHLGTAAKPLICRLFPLEVVQAEDGLRVGIGRCFEAHKSYKADIPEQTPVEITGIDDPARMNVLSRGLDATDSSRMIATPDQGSPEWRNQRMEQGLLMLLEAPWSGWDDLLGFVCETTLVRAFPEGAKPLTNAAFLDAIVTRLNTCGEASYVAYTDDLEQVVPGGYLEQMFGLFTFMRDLKAEPGPPTLTSEQRDYGFHVLREAFFLRSWHKHPSFQISGLVAVVGLLVASWMARDAGEVDAEGQVGDVFAYGLTTWMRYFNFEKHILNMFADLDDYIAFVTRLEETLSA